MIIDPVAIGEIICRSRDYAACPPATMEGALLVASIFAALAIAYVMAVRKFGK